LPQRFALLNIILPFLASNFVPLRKYLSQNCTQNVQRSVGLKDRVETNRQTDTTDRITFPAVAVANADLTQDMYTVFQKHPLILLL